MNPTLYASIDTVVAYTDEDGTVTCESCAWQIDKEELTPVFNDENADGLQCDTCDCWVNGVARLEDTPVSVVLVDAWGNETTVSVEVQTPMLGGWICHSDQREEWNTECWTIIERFVEDALTVAETWTGDLVQGRKTRGGGYGVTEWTATVYLEDAFAEDVESTVARVVAALTA
jgi:hypothetical protein